MKELKAFVASSYNEQKKLCGYGILLKKNIQQLILLVE